MHVNCWTFAGRLLDRVNTPLHVATHAELTRVSKLLRRRHRASP